MTINCYIDSTTSISKGFCSHTTCTPCSYNVQYIYIYIGISICVDILRMVGRNNNDSARTLNVPSSSLALFRRRWPRKISRRPAHEQYRHYTSPVTNTHPGPFISSLMIIIIIDNNHNWSRWRPATGIILSFQQGSSSE